EPVRKIGTFSVVRESLPGIARLVRDLCGSAADEADIAPRAVFRLTPFDQRIAPLAQRRNVDIDPVVPPVDGARIVAEGGAFIRRQSCAQAFDVDGLEYVVVVENERLEKSDQLDHLLQFALLPGERRTNEGYRLDSAVDGLHDNFLRRRGQLFIASFGHRNRIEFRPQPVLEAVLRTVILAVAESGQLN